MKQYIHKIAAGFLLLFGLLTLFLSSSIILNLFNIRAKEGNYVLFVVWANFICSILYLIAAYGFFTSKKWTSNLLGAATMLLFIAFVALIVHVYSGGIYETKTIGAMLFRTSLTMILTLIAYYNINKKNNHVNI